MLRTPGRRGQMAQSIVEFAVSAPVLILLLLGGFDTAVMISDKVVAGAACRQGARLAGTRRLRPPCRRSSRRCRNLQAARGSAPARRPRTQRLTAPSALASRVFATSVCLRLEPDLKGLLELERMRREKHSGHPLVLVDQRDSEEVALPVDTVSYTHLRAHETRHDLVC